MGDGVLVVWVQCDAAHLFEGLDFSIKTAFVVNKAHFQDDESFRIHLECGEGTGDRVLVLNVMEIGLVQGELVFEVVLQAG